jgi:hypothetical protein
MSPPRSSRRRSTLSPGLFTGDAYKSENIDAVVALNKEVKSLQEGLLLSADHASALNEALKGAGVGA